ncbi:MAG: beta-lactamase family protein [Frankiaceae bacterium]|nr:beta-lactamase family protein [Frankiaceae bacterium]
MTEDAAYWQDRLAALADKHGVVGASLAIQHGAQVVTAATGVLNLATGHPVTPDTLFQVGSITKVWTATLVMQLVDDGLLDLDGPVVSYLPDFRVADAEVARTLTIRQLLTHTSGIDGDFFPDFGRGDDALPRYVEAMASLRQVHPPGAIMSYTNSGFVLLGHLVARLRGTTWEAALRERLLTPLGIPHAGTFAEEALLQATATGHLYDATTGVTVTPVWAGHRSVGPSGALFAKATDLLAFAQLHLSGGVSKDGVRLLSEESVAAMQHPEIDVKTGRPGTSQGLGWALETWGGQRVFGHGGQTTGNLADLVVLPDAGLAISITTNGGREPGELLSDILSEVALALAGVEKPKPLTPPISPVTVDPSRYVGRYSCEGFQVDIVETDGGALQLDLSVSDQLADLMVPAMTLELIAVDEEVMLGRVAGLDHTYPCVFFDLDGDRYLHGAGRAFRRRLQA